MTDTNNKSGVVRAVALIGAAAAGTTVAVPLAIGLGLAALLWGASQVDKKD